MGDDAYAAMQQLLMENPCLGDVMPGCGGLRKLRTSDVHRGKGKRGGSRVIYLYLPDTRWFFMLDIYSKDEKEDLSSSEKALLARYADQLKQQAQLAIPKRRKL
ncbi:MAG: toxin [Planctomycetota bacterium]|nr:MAG: toxin [Planctomycetota bacterium]